MWWAEDKISNQDFISSLQYLVENQILVIPEPEIISEPFCGPGTVLDVTNEECVIPEEPISNGIFPDSIEKHRDIVLSWIKTTALWWAEDKISNQDFISSLQYLVENQILIIPVADSTLVITGTNSTQVSQTQPDVFIQKKSTPNISSSWSNINRIDDFVIQGHGNADTYHLRLKLISIDEREIAADGTISISIMDNKNRILYLDAFSVRKSDFTTSLDTFNGKEILIYTWEIPVSDVKYGYGKLGIANIVFTDRVNNSFSNKFDKVSIPQFN